MIEKIRTYDNSSSGSGGVQDIISSDGSVDITQQDNIFDLSVPTGDIPPGSIRIELTQEDSNAGTKTIDLGSYNSFILTTDNGATIPAGFTFVGTGNVNYDSTFSFSFPSGAYQFLLKDGNANTLIDSSTILPNGIPSGETFAAIPERSGQWVIEPESTIVSIDNSVIVNRLPDGKTTDLSVNKIVESYYAANATQFNAGVIYLNSKGGGILYITGIISLQEFVYNNIPNQQYTVADWLSYDNRETSSGARLTNAQSIIDFGANLNNIRIESYTPTATIRCMFNNKMYTLKGQRLDIKSISFTNNTTQSLSAFKVTTQPYLQFGWSLNLDTVSFNCEGGYNNGTSAPVPRNLAWQVGTIPDGFNVDISIFSCKRSRGFYIETQSLTTTILQKEVVISITGTTNYYSFIISILNSTFRQGTLTYPQPPVFQIVDNSTKNSGYKLFIGQIQGINKQVVSGDFMTTGATRSDYILNT